MKGIYAIHDRLADELVGLRMYTVMCFRTDNEAARYFADAINDETSILNKHPGDYTLVMLGHLMDDGQIVPAKEIRVIATGDAVLAIQEHTAPKMVKDA